MIAMINQLSRGERDKENQDNPRIVQKCEELSDTSAKITDLTKNPLHLASRNDYGGGITAPTAVERALSSLLEFTAVVS